MIALIGILFSCYVIMKMLEMIIYHPQPPKAIIAVGALITVVVAIFVLVVLANSINFFDIIQGITK